jgi:hypothetical protein
MDDMAIRFENAGTLTDWISDEQTDKMWRKYNFQFNFKKCEVVSIPYLRAEFKDHMVGNDEERRKIESKIHPTDIVDTNPPMANDPSRIRPQIPIKEHATYLGIDITASKHRSRELAIKKLRGKLSYLAKYWLTLDSTMQKTFQNCLIDAMFRYYFFVSMLMGDLSWKDCTYEYSRTTRYLFGYSNTIPNEIIAKAYDIEHLKRQFTYFQADMMSKHPISNAVNFTKLTTLHNMILEPYERDVRARANVCKEMQDGHFIMRFIPLQRRIDELPQPDLQCIKSDCQDPAAEINWKEW